MSNPFQSPGAVPSKQPIYGGPANPMQPLHDAAGWMIFIGWFNLIFGILYALTIIGLLFAWIPIWIGICLKNAGESLKAGYPANDPRQLFRASSNLATTFKIVGVMCIIYLVLIVLYICAFLLMMVIAIGGAAAAAN